jgi:O-antigen/teichoic acid export membrane protein
MLCSLIIGLWFARYLGPEQYGQWNLALSILTLASVFSSWGLEHLVVRDLSREEIPPTHLLGSSFAIIFVSGVFICLGLLLWSLLFAQGQVQQLLWILAFQPLFMGWQCFDHHFQWKVQRKWVAITRMAILLVSNTCKLYFISYKFPLFYFAMVTVTESLALLLGLSFCYHRCGLKMSSWRVHTNTIFNLLKEGAPLLLQSMIILLYSRVDQFMIDIYLGTNAIGEYVAGRKLPDMWCFFPGLFISTLYPILIKTDQNSRDQNHWTKAFSVLFWTGIGFAIPVSLYRSDIIHLCFGQEYQNGAAVLSVQAWSTLFISMGMLSSKWYSTRGLTHLMFLRALSGLFINMSLNIYFIPKLGILGAISATCISQASTAIFFDLIHPKTRPLILLKYKACSPFALLKTSETSS